MTPSRSASSAEYAPRLVALLAAARELEARVGVHTSTEGQVQGTSDHAIDVTRRLQRSVVRPLQEAVAKLTDLGTGPEAGTAEGGGGQSAVSALSGDGHEATASGGDGVWRLACEATRLRLTPDLPAEVREATAALQDLALTLAAADGEAVLAAHMTELTELQAALSPQIQSQTDGPYLVTNVERLTNWLGEVLPTRPQMALCRCGASKLKPFCDGTHAEIEFSSEKDPKRVPDHRDTYVGQQVTVLDNRGICQHSGFCTDRLATVFHSGEEPFVTPSGGRMDEIIRAVRDCPSGALSYAIDQVEARDDVDYHDTRDPAIEISKDGPYRITGAITLYNGVGDDEPRTDGASREHCALCRCGHSQNKPFCSGMHWYVEFTDPPPESEPTIFQWAGGLPALTRMTRLFYEKYVPQDPLLAPLFAEMSADHPERVAKWLAEVFCGPRNYSEQYGGYSRMISQHIGKGLTEERRARWVALLLRSARDAGLPNDAEFRSAFGSYIEWGSRLAVENSQPGAKPPERMPMPHWDWHTAAGPPGSRISALAPSTQEPEAPVVLPAADEPVSFEKHIKPLFRPSDRQSMSFAFDLGAFDDVKQHADAILERLHNGTMPCDGAWPADKIDAFERWTTTGREQ